MILMRNVGRLTGTALRFGWPVEIGMEDDWGRRVVWPQ